MSKCLPSGNLMEHDAPKYGRKVATAEAAMEAGIKLAIATLSETKPKTKKVQS